MNTKKTTFNRKGLINETANVKELREMRILYYTCLANALRESADDEEIVRLTARGIADFFNRRYELRYNTVKKIEEWRPRDGVYREWQQLTDRDLNRMTFEQMNEGGDGWGIDLQLYLHSTMVPQYNPQRTFHSPCLSLSDRRCQGPTWLVHAYTSTINPDFWVHRVHEVHPILVTGGHTVT